MATKRDIKELINMDYNALVELSRKSNRSQLESVVSTMTRVANRRIGELNKSDIGRYSPALKTTGGKKFDTKIGNMGTNDLMHQYAQLKKFLQAKSSTVSGWNKIRSGIASRTGAKKLFQSNYKSKRSATIWHNREKRFWKLYNELVDNYGGIITQLDSDRIQAMLMTVQTMKKTKKSDADISEIMNRYITELYEAANKGEDISDAEFEDEIKILYAK